MLTMFLVPSVPARDEAVFWQLQLLGPAYGFDIKMAQRSRVTPVAADAQASIRDSDVVVAIVTKPLAVHALAELDAARRYGRPVLVVVDAALGRKANIPEGVETVQFVPGSDISQVATGIMEHLGHVLPQPAPSPSVPAPRPADNMKVAVGWVVGVGLGLLALAALAKKK
jgi:hypothetical protein